MCMMLFALLVYRNCLHKATNRIIENIHTKEHELMSEEDEIKAMILADDLILTNKVPCGKEKCFFVSTTGAHEGYLVARSGRDFSHSEKYDRLVEGWELATRLQQQYNIKHFLLAPPEIIPVSDHLAALINKNLWYETQDLPVDEIPTSRKKHKPRFAIDSHTYVQKVQVAPTPNLLLACAHSNRPHFERHLDNFLVGVNNKFARNLSKNLAQTKKLLQQEPCLVKDFQVILDQQGNIFHLDFDRCFHTREIDETQECFQYLNDMEKRIHDTLKDPFQPSNIKKAKRIICGKQKCIYRVNSNHDVGYLVARSGVDDAVNTTTMPGGFKTIKAGWHLAQNLTQEYGIQHFLMAPPMNITISEELAAQLNQNLYSEKRRYRLRNSTRYQVGSSVYAQKVRLAPQPNLLIGTRQSNLDSLDGVLDKFIDTVKDKELFVRRFRENSGKMRALLHAETCMANDLQALVDTKGEFYHLDFDRCFLPDSTEKQNMTSEELAETFQAIDEIEDRVYRAVESAQPLFQTKNLVSAERVPCGAYKCFYALKSDPSLGYLVAPLTTPRILKNMGSEDDWYDMLVKSWHYAEHLRRENNIKHFLLAPPTNVTVSKGLASRLNKNLWNVGHGVAYDGRYDKGERYKVGSTAFIQKVKTAPEPNLLIGIQFHKHKTFKQQLGEFLSSVNDKEEFGRRFSKSLAETRKLLQQEPCLTYDFQALVDTSANFYHLDFERCLQPTRRNETELYLEAIDDIERQVHEAVQEH